MKSLIEQLRQRYEDLYDLPFPEIWGKASNIVGFDSHVAGLTTSVLAGRNKLVMPRYHMDVLMFVSKLQKKAALTPGEKEFLEYYAALEDLMSLIIRIAKPDQWRKGYGPRDKLHLDSLKIP